MNFRYALQDAWRCAPEAGLIMRHAAWDLMLGVVPILLAWALSRALNWSKGWRGSVRWPLAALWLVFLPNAAYLIAALRSIPDVICYIFQAFARYEIDGSRRTTASLVWVLFYVGVSLAGVACYGAAIYPVQRRFLANRRAALGLGLLVSLASAVGVELGLSRRYNSWDLPAQPAAILQAATDRLVHPGVETLFVLLFTLFLLLLWQLTAVFGAGLRALYGRRPEVASAAGATTAGATRDSSP